MNKLFVILAIFVTACSQPKIIRSTQSILSDTEIHFRFGSAKIGIQGNGLLQDALLFLNRYPQNAVLIEGHTDSVGSEKSNLDLGDRRARAVKAWFIINGIEDNRFTTVTYGESRPKMTASKDAKNRRVVLKDLSK